MRALIIFLIALVVFAMPSIAEDGWTNYLSSTGVFKTRLPTGHKTALNSFLIGDKLAASHEETAGAIDQRPYKDVLMNYIVKFDQTIGPSLNEKELPILLDQEVSTYENYYKTSFAGTTQENKKLNLPGANGVDLTMAFQDPKLGARTIRARI